MSGGYDVYTNCHYMISVCMIEITTQWYDENVKWYFEYSLETSYKNGIDTTEL